MIIKKQNEIKKVTVSSLVMLSAVDHYTRESYGRVIGICLGERKGENVSVTNSFATFFRENEDNYFLDTTYIHTMLELFHKVNTREKVVGWYHTDDHIHGKDLAITQSLEKICNIRDLVMVNISVKEVTKMPISAFYLQESKLCRINRVEVSSDENEEIGIEHLLKDIKKSTNKTLSDRKKFISQALAQFSRILDKIANYLTKENPDQYVLDALQKIFDILPKKPFDLSSSGSELLSLELIESLVAMNQLYESENK